MEENVYITLTVTRQSGSFSANGPKDLVLKLYAEWLEQQK